MYDISEEGAEIQLKALVKTAEVLTLIALRILDESIKNATSMGKEITEELKRSLLEESLRKTAYDLTNKAIDKVEGINGEGNINFEKLEKMCDDIVKKNSYFFEQHDYKQGIKAMEDMVYRTAADRYAKIEFKKFQINYDKLTVSELQADKKYSGIVNKAYSLLKKGEARPRLGSIESNIAQAKKKAELQKTGKETISKDIVATKLNTKDIIK